MIRKYKASTKSVAGGIAIITPLGEVSTTEGWFDAREKASVLYQIARECIQLEEIPQPPVPPPVFDASQRPPPAVTPHLRKQRTPKKASKKKARR